MEHIDLEALGLLLRVEDGAENTGEAVRVGHGEVVRVGDGEGEEEAYEEVRV